VSNPKVPNPSRRAFLLRTKAPEPQQVSVVLSAACLAFHGVHCEACRESCEAGALRFMQPQGALPRPVFDTERCTRCGECARVCPASAISVAPREDPPA
jgi:ferredoxin-type protein NapF